MLVWAALNFLLCMADIVNLYCSKNSLLHLQGWSGDTAHQNYFRLFYRPWGQKKKIHCFFLPYDSDLASFIDLVPCTLLQIVAVSEEVFGCHTEGYHWYVVGGSQGHT